MKNVEIITIGDELLSGSLVDTNASIIAERLLSIGFPVSTMTSIGDNQERLEELLKVVSGRSDLALITGGLGPTDDDITAKAVSRALGLPLVLDEGSLQRIQRLFDRYGLEMTSNNEKQAWVPQGSTVVENPIGTAPGFIVRYKIATLIFLPGVPKELKAMLDETVIPFLMKERKDQTLYKSRVLKIFGITEAKMGQLIKGVAQGLDKVSIASLPRFPENRLRITVNGDDEKALQQILEEVEVRIRSRLGDVVYGHGEDTLEGVVGRLLQSKRASLALAESCTGGLISHRLTNIPGSSDYLHCCYVVYSTKAKEEILDIPREMLNRFGLVSKEVAEAMARAVRRSGSTDLGLSTTGIAGPTGATCDKPIGTVFISLSDSEERFVREFHFHGGREQIKGLAATMALDWLRRYLMGMGELRWS